MNQNIYNTLNYQEKFIQLINNEQWKLLDAKNFSMLMEILNEGPKSVLEIVNSFKQKENEKHVKTIYRYLRKLQKARLVVPAGLINTDIEKRVNASRTLYGRSARIFYPYQIYDKLIEDYEDTKIWFDKATIIIEYLLDSQKDLGKMDRACLSQLMGEIFKKQHQILINLEKISEKIDPSLFQDFEERDVVRVLDIYIDLVLFVDKTEWQDKLLNCFDKRSKKVS